MSVRDNYYVDDVGQNNPYTTYYSNQAGSGLSGFGGVRLQRGRGLGTFLSTSLLPLLKSAGKALGFGALNAGKNIARDVLAGANIKSAAIRHAKTEGKHLLGKALAKLDAQDMQTGSGLDTFGPQFITAKKRKRRKSTKGRKPKTKTRKRRRKTTKTKTRKRALPPAHSLFA